MAIHRPSLPGIVRPSREVDILISIQNDREWRILASDVLARADIAADPALATNTQSVRHRELVDGAVAACFAARSRAELVALLETAGIAFATVSGMADLAASRPHPHHRHDAGRRGRLPAPALHREGRRYGAVPALGADTVTLRAEFAAGAMAS